VGSPVTSSSSPGPSSSQTLSKPQDTTPQKEAQQQPATEQRPNRDANSRPPRPSSRGM
jgi:hypothetical protein